MSYETSIPIPGLPGYRIDRDANVFSDGAAKWAKHQHKPTLGARGYLRVRISPGHQQKRVERKVHQLVALAFIGPRPEGCTLVRHLNGNPLDNRVENLAWGTARDNVLDAIRHGTMPRGLKHSEAIKAGLRAVGR